MELRCVACGRIEAGPDAEIQAALDAARARGFDPERCGACQDPEIRARAETSKRRVASLKRRARGVLGVVAVLRSGDPRRSAELLRAIGERALERYFDTHPETDR